MWMYSLVCVRPGGNPEDRFSHDGAQFIYCREKDWIESEKMGAFLSVAQGSAEPPVFLEIDYKQADIKEPIALVGKGITFDRYPLSNYLMGAQ